MYYFILVIITVALSYELKVLFFINKLIILFLIFCFKIIIILGKGPKNEIQKCALWSRGEVHAKPQHYKILRKQLSVHPTFVHVTDCMSITIH